jgi:hypothetical protein
MISFSKFYLFNSYGAGNIHLLDTVQYGPSSIRLNITADEPVSPLNMKLENISSLYNYTALLTGINP